MRKSREKQIGVGGGSHGKCEQHMNQLHGAIGSWRDQSGVQGEVYVQAKLRVCDHSTNSGLPE